ncbi:flagellar hook-basal body complex protein [Clostridium gasigenes]|nr:flagellar hook-basal body complex protein [Clostridium gasigenes]MBU3135972.1 flagellar hook-basal body complex protein [Clostridium gasigenes]
MLRSMYSGISGMKVNQVKLDVIGNNISNVGTTSFKSSRARFSDMLSQNVSDAMAPGNNKGGLNASQVGLGVQLASIDSVMTQGMMQPTGRSLDVAIDGAGFFMVSKGPAINDGVLEVNHRAGSHGLTAQSLANGNTEIMYSRDGSFILDEGGNLLTGDGYRVMGYSLTNDDSSMEATAKEPNDVSTAGLDFKFGPGSQLNGYKVVLGTVGPGTVTTADIDKTQKLIVVNGDFSTINGLTTAQVESAVNKGLSSGGISQQVFVSGKPINIADLSSEGVKGGADATSPNAVTIGGFTLQLSEGSGLNGYTFQIGEVGKGTDLKVNLDPDTKKIKIDGDFVGGNVSAKNLQEKINAEIKGKGYKQQVLNISGSALNLANITGKTDISGTIAAPPTGALVDKDGKVVTEPLAGLNFTFGNGKDLNGYTISAQQVDGPTEVLINKEGPSIIIKGNFSSVDPTKVATSTDIDAKMKTALKNASIKTTITVGGTVANNISSKIKIAGGTDNKAPKEINVGGFKFELPQGTEFNGIEIEIGDTRSTVPSAEVTLQDPTKPIAADNRPAKIVLSGDFASYPGTSAVDLENAINAALKTKGLAITDDYKIKAGGTAKIYSGLTADAIEGGGELMTATALELGSMQFAFTPGGSLNGYKIQIGKITAGTKSDTEIDEKNKTITINGDFTTAGAMTIDAAQNSINKALQNKGIDQSIMVTGKTMEIGGTESGLTLGGTPIQSLGTDGLLSFVDGTKTLKAYDGQLKTMKIPDKVRIPGTDLELRVKTYTIDSTGIINGVLEDGRVAALGQIGMANFKNPEGLAKLGGNLYSSSVNSGDAIIKSGVGTLGDDNSKGYGANLQGMLEMSNVDLAEQFTDMIISTRAFQASGKMITTGDEILQDIINLKR